MDFEQDFGKAFQEAQAKTAVPRFGERYFVVKSDKGFYVSRNTWSRLFHRAAAFRPDQDLADRIARRVGGQVEENHGYGINFVHDLADIGEPDAIQNLEAAVKLMVRDGASDKDIRKIVNVTLKAEKKPE